MPELKVYNETTKQWESANTPTASQVPVTHTKFTTEGKTNVEQVLESMSSDMDTMKGNIAWLAKHGGGGSGGGGSQVNASILVNGYNTGNTVTITDEGLTVSVQGADALRWNFSVVINSITQVKTVLNQKSFTIPLSEWESYTQSTVPVAITAVNSSTMTTIYWNGTIQMASIKLACASTYSTAFTTKDTYQITVNYVVGSTGTYQMFVNGVAYDNGKFYSQLEGGYNIVIGDIQGTEFIGGNNLLVFTMKNVDNPNIYESVSTNLVLTTSSPIVYSNALSMDRLNPTSVLLYGNTITIPTPFTVYYQSTSASTYTYKISYKTPSGTIVEGVRSGANAYNKLISNASIQITNAVEGFYEITIESQDSNVSSKVGSSTYFVQLTKPSTGLLHNDHEGNDTIFDFTAYNSTVDATNAKWISNNKSMDIININALSSNVNTQTHSIRLQNSSYLYYPIASKDYKIGEVTAFTLELCYKCDYHADDERTVLQWGHKKDMNPTTGLPSRGIMIRDHDIYIGPNKIYVLEDDNITNIAITYYSEGDTGNYFLYIDGVIEAAGTVANATIVPMADATLAPIYIGAAEYDTESTNFTDMNVYRVTMYNKCLSPYDILIDFANNEAITHFKNNSPDTEYITECLLRNFIDTNEDGSIKQSLLYVHNKSFAGENFDNTNEDLSTNFSVSNFIDGIAHRIIPEIDNYEVPIPILYINTPDWSWANFVSPISGAISQTTAQFQYYDKNLGDKMVKQNKVLNCLVSPQGTSTLANYIKNLDIELAEGTVFSPKEEWFPEKVYTLKADIVDSSHSLNTSIGKFINTEFGILEDGSNFYPYSQNVKDKYTQFKRTEVGTKTFPKATLKHGVEGFPVFVIMQFSDTIKTLGIYQFILGRKSPRNLGYETITKFTYKEDNVEYENPTLAKSDYPLVFNDATIQTSNNEGLWIEFEENHPFGSDTDIQATTAQSFTTKTWGGAFWQSDPNYYDQSASIKFSNLSSTSWNTVSAVVPFMDFVRNIQRFPVLFKRNSSLNNGIVSTGCSMGSTYPACDYNDDRSWTPNGQSVSIVSASADDIEALVNSVNMESISKYFPMMMWWGLKDNFQKNMPVKIYRSSTGGWELPILGVYDCDSGIGQDNQAVPNVDEAMWICGLYNSGNNFFERRALSNDNSTIVATGNKLWYIDHPEIRNNIGGSRTGSIFSNAWYELLNHMQNKRGVAWNELADYYYTNYFLKQTEGCGELLFNLTYIAKYITKYHIDGSSTKTNQLEKLHGRRRYQVKRWMKNRTLFLNSMFTALGPCSTGMTIDSTATQSISINASLGPKLATKTNAPVILGYNNQGSGKAFVFCKRNELNDVYFGASALSADDSSYSHSLTNPNQIIQIGDGFNPLYSVGFGMVNTGSGLPYLSDYNVSAPSRSATNMNFLMEMTSDYMKSRFCRLLDDGTYRSELRNIDFRNTLPATGVNQYVLNLKTGFDKLQTLYINNSCITSLTFPDNTSLRDFDISGSNLVNLSVDSQNFIKVLNIKNCAAMQSLEVLNCFNLEEIQVDSTNRSLTEINVASCDSLESFSLQDNNRVTDISINCANLKAVVIKNCAELKTLTLSTTSLVGVDVSGCAKLENINFVGTTASCANLKALNVSNTAVKNVYYNGNKEEGLVNLVNFTELISVNFLNNTGVVNIQFANDFSKPINLTNPFQGCINLERVFGHIKLNPVSYQSQSGMFFGCSKFSIHGEVNDTTTYKGFVIKVYTPDYKGEHQYYYKMPLQIVSNDRSSWDSLTLSSLFTSGLGVTNISLSDNSSVLVSAFSNTKCTTFDVYYIFNILGLSGLSSDITINRTFYGLEENIWDWKYGNIPNRDTFYKCSCITSLSEPFTCGTVFWYSPTITNDNYNDDGLFSPLTNLTNLTAFGGTIFCSRHVFRRQVGNYKITSISWQGVQVVFDNDTDSYVHYYSSNMTFSDLQELASNIDKIGVYNNMFYNMPELTSLYSAFSGLAIHYDTITIPDTVTTVNSAFNATYGTGTIDLPTIFATTKQNHSVQTITNSFRVSGTMPNQSTCVFRIYNGMFTKLSNLTMIGYNPNNDTSGSTESTSFNGNGLIKTIYASSTGSTLATEFPTSLVSNLTNLQVFAGFFQNITNTSFASGIPELPGNMFQNCTKLYNVACLFRELNFPFKLTGNSFANCTVNGLNNAYRLFYHTISSSTRSKITGPIPYRFFYHGSRNITAQAIVVTNWAEHDYKYHPKENVPITSSDVTYISEVPYYNNSRVYLSSTDNHWYYDQEFTRLATKEQESSSIATGQANNPNEDPFFVYDTASGQYKSIPDASGETHNYQSNNYTLSYNRPNQSLRNLDQCFYGCVGITAFTDSIDPNTVLDKNPSYIIAGYTYKLLQGVWSQIDRNSDTVNKQYLGYWCYNGNPLSLVGYNTSNMLYLESRTITNVIDNLGKGETLNYLAPPDLLRYCEDSENTVVTGLFENCGVNYTLNGSGWADPDAPNNLFYFGIRGRICPYMFKNIPSITNISRMFKFCRRIGSYKVGDKVYQIPSDLFVYGNKITNLQQAFLGLSFQKSTEFNVFGGLPVGEGLDIRAILAACQFDTDSTTRATLSGLFVGKQLNLCSGAFSNYGLSIVTPTIDNGGVSRDTGTEGYQCINNNYVTFENNFTSQYLPQSTYIHYMFYKYGSNNTCVITEPSINLLEHNNK